MEEVRQSTIRRLQAWAQECASKDFIERAYLFGSLVFDAGEQFEIDKSDVDIIVLLPRDCKTPLGRIEVLDKLASQNLSLEVELLQILHQSDASRPIMSMTPVTDFELSFGIHKSGKPDLYSYSEFLDLTLDTAVAMPLPPKGATVYQAHGAATAVLEQVQDARNKYVATTANAKRLVASWDDKRDPLPKPLIRMAAQFRYYRDDLSDDSRFDSNRGLSVISDLVSAREREDPEYRAIQKWLDVRRGGRGKREPLSPRHWMLLWELIAIPTEEILRSRTAVSVDSSVTNGASESAKRRTSDGPPKVRPVATAVTALPDRAIRTQDVALPPSKHKEVSRPEAISSSAAYQKPPSIPTVPDRPPSVQSQLQRKLLTKRKQVKTMSIEEARIEFKRLSVEAKRATHRVSSVVVRCIYDEQRGSMWNPTRDTYDSYEETINDAMEKKWIKDAGPSGELVPNSEHPLIGKIMNAVNELRSFMESPNFEDLNEELEEEHEIIIDITSKEFFQLFVNGYPRLP